MSLVLFLLAWAQAHAGTLTVEVLDVGQGDSILLTSPAGKRVLIDASTRGADVYEMLRNRDISELNLVIATHAHADHIGGMKNVVEGMEIKLYGDQGLPHTTRTYENLMVAVESSPAKYVSMRAGRVFNLDDGIRIEILGPTEPLLSGTRSDLNSNSVIARVTHGSNCFLFTGDAEEPTEHQLIEAGIEPCNVLKVAHHGSEHSTTNAWLQAVQPKLALISVGANNRYGHPSPETIGRLRSAGAEVHRTDLEGTLKVSSDGSSITLETVDEVKLAGPGIVGGVVGPRPSPAALGATKIDLEPTAKPAATAPAGPTAEQVQAARNAAILPVASAAAAQQINVNTASASALTALPGIGPSKAGAIVAYRDENGPFASLEDLDKVPGIGPSTLEKMREKVRFAE